MQFIETAEDLTRMSGTLAGVPLVALDTEAAGYHRYHDRVCVVQVSTRDETFVVDALAVDITPLGSVFGDPASETILHDADFDLRLLRRDHDIGVHNLFDTKTAAQFLGETTLGLAGLVEKHLGVRLDKKHQRADWARRPLPPELVEYAAEDTRHLPGLRDALRAALERTGRLAWAEEEFRLREATEAVSGENGEAWLKLKNTRDLSPRQLAALRELHAWRDRVAKERDAAPFRVVANETLVAIARALPDSAAALARADGVPPSTSGRYGAELLDAVARAQTLPADKLPVRKRGPRRPPPDPSFDALVDRLRAMRDRRAEQLGLERGFLMPRQQLEVLARTRPRTAEQLAGVEGIRRWQMEAIGEALIGALQRA